MRSRENVLFFAACHHGEDGPGDELPIERRASLRFRNRLKL